MAAEVTVIPDFWRVSPGDNDPLTVTVTVDSGYEIVLRVTEGNWG